MRVAQTLRLENVLQDAGIKLSSVASRILSVSGRQMIEALIAGERDPDVLAELSKARMRSKKADLAEALVGRFDTHHAELAAQILAHVDHLDAELAQLNSAIAERLEPYRATSSCARPSRESDRSPPRRSSLRPARTCRASLRPATFAAGAGVAPASHESAGKHRPAGTRHGAPWLRRHLIEAARAAARTRDTYLAAQYCQVAARRGPN